MSHYCNKHSQSPIRYKTGGSNQKAQLPTTSSQKGDPAKINIKIDYTSPFSESGPKRMGATPNNQRGQQTESTHADLSPLLQQKLAQLQVPTAPFQFQNYVSTEGIALRPHEIDQMKLRQEISAREHELKLLAQMDYLLDLIKNLDQDRNINIDTQKIEEIERLKSDYQSINDDIQNLSFSQNMNASEDKPKRASRHNNNYNSQPNDNNQPLGYSSVGGNQNQPILQDLNEQGDENDPIHSAPLYQSGQIQQRQPQDSLYNSQKNNNNPQNITSSQRSNAPLQSSIRSSQGNRQQQQYPYQQENINSKDGISLVASTQEQLFYQQNNAHPDHDQQNQYNQGEIPQDNNQSGLNQSGRDPRNQSMSNSLNQSKKTDYAKELVGSGVPSYSQQLANILVSSQQSQQPIPDRYDQVYNSNQSNNSSRQNPQKLSSQHSLPQQQQENYSSQPLNQGSLNQGPLTGSYSLKTSQKSQQPINQQYQSNPSHQQLYSSNPQLYQSGQQQQQVPLAQQKLEQSIQTSLQLINSLSKAPASNKEQADKSQLEQQIFLYEKQIKELIEENDCLKKNIADSQFFKKPLVAAENKELYSSIASKGSRTSFTQPQINKDQPENQIIQELQDALHEKESDFQILLSNITQEKDQNKFLQEENEILKQRLQSIEREVVEMTQQRQRLPTFEQQQGQGLEAYSSVEESNYGSNKFKEDQIIEKDPIRRDSGQSQEQQKQQYQSQRLSELESDQKERSIHYQEEIARLNKLLKSVKDELGYQQASHVDYVGRFNQDKMNQLIRKYEEMVESEQIKNMLSGDMQDTLANTISEQEQQIHDLQKKLSGLQDEYEFRESQIKQSNQQKVAELEEKNAELQDSNAGLEENIQSLKIQAQDQTDQIIYINQEMQQIKQRYIEIEMKKENLILENNELKTRIDQLEEVRNQEIGMKEDAIKHITELQALLEQKNQELDALTQQKESIQAEYDELLKSLTEMENNLQVVQQNFSYNRSQHEQLKRETQELKQFIAQKGPIEDETDEIHQSIQELKKELNIQDEEQQQEEDDDEHTKNSKHPNQNDLHHSHSSKHSHHHSSVHSSARFMKDSQNNKNKPQQGQEYDPQTGLKQSQPIYNYDENNQDNQQYNEQEEFACDDCDMCMLEELMRQNENLKQQLLLKEKEIIELKTNPNYYAKQQAQINQVGKTPFSAGKGQIYLEVNDQAYNSRVFESPVARQVQAPNAFTSPQPLRGQFEQQQQRGSLSNSKQPEQQLSSSQKQQLQLQQQQLQLQQLQQLQQQQQQSGGSQSQYQSYSVLQSEIEHLQKIFDKKCKEVDSWKKTYQQFYEQ